MKLFIIIDADNQSRDSRQNIRRLAQASEEWRMVVAGIHPNLTPWRQEWNGDPGVDILKSLSPVDGATDIQLTAVAIEHALAKSYQDWKWIIASHDRCHEALVEILRGKGIDATRHAQITPDVVEGLTTDQNLMAAQLRDLYRELKSRYGHKVHVGNFADAAVLRWPELENRDVRVRLFGVQRFGPIARVAGMKVEGLYITAAQENPS